MKNIHPQSKQVKIITTDGKEFKISSAIQNKKEILLEVDTSNHPAWNQGNISIRAKKGKVASFKNRYSQIKSTR